MRFNLWRRALAAAMFVAGLCAGAARADIPEFLGNWVNNDANSQDITRVVVMPGGPGGVMVHVWAQCYPSDCDWGVVPGHPYVDTFSQHNVNIVTASFNPGFARTLVILKSGPGGLRIQALTEFTDGSGRSDYEYRGGFHRVSFFPPFIPMPNLPPIPLPLQPKWPPLPITPINPMPHPLPILLGAEDCVSFNPGSVHAAPAGSWKVLAGPISLLDFGGDKFGAIRAADLIKNYGFDQQCFVKRPHAPMVYWKSGPTIPKNNMPGQDCIGLNPVTASVGNFGGSWKVVDGSSWLLDYGPDKGAAEQALSVIKVYHLNRECFVGAPTRVMSYWLAE